MLEIKDSEDDYIYFGEYSQKLQKDKRDGHSYRRRQSLGNANTKIKRGLVYSNWSNTDEDKMQEIAVTDIDDYFDYSFWKGRDRYGYYSNTGRERTLNAPELWEEVEDLLKETAVKVTKEFNRYEGTCTLHYDVPVNGHVLCPNTYMNSKKKKIQVHWFHWNGKYYDPRFVYQFVAPGYYADSRSYYVWSRYTGYQQNGYLKPICPLLNQSNDPQMTLGPLQNSNRLNRIAAKAFRPSSSSSSGKARDYVEIDLGRVCELTHIGTLGGYPKKLQIFTNRREGDLEYTSRRRKRTHRSFVYVIDDPQQLCWVTQYRVQYRDILTGQWLNYETAFVGNQDVCTENIHKISLICRYLRITPTEFHNEAAMRVLIYGDGVHSKIEKADLEMETIRYSVSQPSSHLSFDGYSNGHRYDYCKIESKTVLKRKLVHDELDSYFKMKPWYKTDLR